MKLIKIRSVYSTKIAVDTIAGEAEIKKDPILKLFSTSNYSSSNLTVRRFGSEGYINLDCVAELIPFEAPFITNNTNKYSDANLEIKTVYTLRRTNGQNLGLNGTDYSTVIDEESAKKIMAQCEIVD